MLGADQSELQWPGKSLLRGRKAEVTWLRALIRHPRNERIHSIQQSREVSLAMSPG